MSINPAELQTAVEYAERKLSFEDFKTRVSQGALNQLGRLKDDLVFYRSWRGDLLKEWRVIDHYVLNKVFSWPFQVASDGFKEIVIPNPIPFLIIFCSNDFPYAKEDDVIQDLIWSTRALSTEEVEQTLAQHRPDSMYEVIWFENPAALRSVKSVVHYHVLSRLKQ